MDPSKSGNKPRGSIHTTIMELGLNRPSLVWFWGPVQNGSIYDARLPHPRSPPPPSPWYPPLPVKWVVVLFALLLSPSGLVWPCPLPPCGVGPVVFLVGAPPVGGSVFYRGMVWLLPLASSNTIGTCLVPSPPVGWGGWSFWLAPPRLCGAVCSAEIWHGCCRLLALMSSLRARYHTKYDVALFSLHTLPLSLL